MKSFLLIMLSVAVSLGMCAQKSAGFSATTTLYKDYQPAKITLTDGKVIRQNKANVFLKNGRLLFKRGMFDMEANMTQIQKVEFADRTFERVDTMLVSVVDTIAGKRILCATTIDIEAYKSKAINDRVVTNLSLGEQVSMTTVDLSPTDELKYPLIHTYFYEIDGKSFEVHERTITRMLNKDKRRMLKTYMQMPDFDWGNREYLLKILQLFD